MWYVTCKSILAGSIICIMCIYVLCIYAYVTLINKYIYDVSTDAFVSNWTVINALYCSTQFQPHDALII